MDSKRQKDRKREKDGKEKYNEVDSGRQKDRKRDKDGTGKERHGQKKKIWAKMDRRKTQL